jgi:hypothetical protein
MAKKNKQVEPSELDLHVAKLARHHAKQIPGFGTMTVIDWFGIRHTLTDVGTFTANDMAINHLANTYINALERIDRLNKEIQRLKGEKPETPPEPEPEATQEPLL